MVEQPGSRAEPDSANEPLQVSKIADLIFEMPDVVTGDVPFTINFKTDAPSQYIDGQVVTAKLSTSVSNWPICDLNTNFDLGKLSVSMTLPASVGPSGAYYLIALGPENLFGNVTWPYSVPVYSDEFFLAGGTGTWSPYEAPAAASGDDDDGGGFLSKYFAEYVFSAGASIPCTSYDCARRCSAKERPDQAAWRNGSVWLDCLSGCPGVSVIPESLQSIATATDWGTPSTATADAPLVTPTGSCDAGKLETPCGTKCCASGEYCLLWSACEKISKAALTTKTSHTISAAVKTTTTTTGADRTSTPGPTTTNTSQTTPNAASRSGLRGWHLLFLPLLLSLAI